MIFTAAALTTMANSREVAVVDTLIVFVLYSLTRVFKLLDTGDFVRMLRLYIPTLCYFSVPW